MTFTLFYPPAGRGAFPSGGLGGTLDVSGYRLGSYYRSPAGSSMAMPGLTGALAVKRGLTCSINDYAVHRAVRALQPFFGTTPDGILGPNSDAAIRAYQGRHNLYVDGIVGPKTCKSLFAPLVDTAAEIAGHPEDLATVARGTISMESMYDPGAVGVSTPQDLGIGQINGPAHPNLSVNDRFDPTIAIPWVVNFIDSNMRAMGYDLDSGIAAYNLGVTGAKAWTAAGRPQMWYGKDVYRYIQEVKQQGA